MREDRDGRASLGRNRHRDGNKPSTAFLGSCCHERAPRKAEDAATVQSAGYRLGSGAGLKSQVHRRRPWVKTRKRPIRAVSRYSCQAPTKAGSVESWHR
jgi:hypothetical protein